MILQVLFKDNTVKELELSNDHFSFSVQSGYDSVIDSDHINVVDFNAPPIGNLALLIGSSLRPIQSKKLLYDFYFNYKDKVNDMETIKILANENDILFDSSILDLKVKRILLTEQFELEESQIEINNLFNFSFFFDKKPQEEE